RSGCLNGRLIARSDRSMGLRCSRHTGRHRRRGGRGGHSTCGLQKLTGIRCQGHSTRSGRNRRRGGAEDLITRRRVNYLSTITQELNGGRVDIHASFTLPNRWVSFDLKLDVYVIAAFDSFIDQNICTSLEAKELDR